MSSPPLSETATNTTAKIDRNAALPLNPTSIATSAAKSAQNPPAIKLNIGGMSGTELLTIS